MYMYTWYKEKFHWHFYNCQSYFYFMKPKLCQFLLFEISKAHISFPLLSTPNLFLYKFAVPYNWWLTCENLGITCFNVNMGQLYSAHNLAFFNLNVSKAFLVLSTSDSRNVRWGKKNKAKTSVVGMSCISFRDNEREVAV